MSGGGGTTQTTSNSPPIQYLNAYSDVLARAQQNAATPYQQYQGQLQAGFSPAQEQAFNLVGSTPGITAPYLNQASQDFTSATADLKPSYQPQSDQANQQYQNVAASNLPGAITPWQNQAQAGFAQGSKAIDPTQYSGSAIQGFESPYTQQVVDATQAQFNQQNAQAQTALSGNAASKGALGGDRLGVAQAQLAGQQQMAQAPVIAGLRNTGFNQAQQEFNQQQQTNLGAQQNTAGRQMQAAQGYQQLGAQSLTAAQQQAQLQQAAGQGFAGLGQMGLSGAQSQGWLNSQAGQGMAGLGNQALNNTLTEANALQGVGAQQQQYAQQSLNIPYQQWQAQLAYPYQQTGWLSNIAQGLGSNAGGTGSSTTPGASGFSQAAGLGVAGIGAAGQAGWLGSGAGSAAAGAVDSGAWDTAATAAAEAWQRGGAIRGFASGGEVPDLSVNGFGVGATPGSEDVTVDGSGIPNAGETGVPDENPKGGSPLIKRDYGSTSHTEVPHDSTIGTILKTAGQVAATVYGGPAGGAAAAYLGSQVHFNRGGAAGFDAGGPIDGEGLAGQPTPIDTPPITTPDYSRSPIPSVPAAARRSTIPRPPPGAKAENIGDEAQGWVKALKANGGFGTREPSSARGGSVPVVPHGFAAGGSAPITVTTVPNAQGKGVPIMSVDPAASGPTAVDQMNAYLARTKAGAATTAPTQAPAPAPAPAAPAPDAPGFTPDQTAQLQTMLRENAEARARQDLPSGNGPMRRGGLIRGFDDGGDVGDAPDMGFGPPAPDDPGVRPGVHARHQMARGVPPDQVWDAPRPVADQPPAPEQKGFLARNSAPLVSPQSLRSAWDAVSGWPNKIYQDAVDTNRRFARETAPATDTDLSDPIPQGIPPPAYAPGGGEGTTGLSAPSDEQKSIAAGSAPGADADLPPETPANPVANPSPKTANPPGTAGFGASPELHGGTWPAGDGQGNTPTPAQLMAAGAQSTGRKNLGDASDELRDTRALREDKANPWLSVMQAGFGIMAGNSPHALQNIGAGAMQGMNQYVTADRAAKDLAARVDENRVRLKETQAYRDATGGINQQKADAQTSRAATAAAAQVVTGQYKAFQQANPRMTQAQLLDKTMTTLQGTTNPETGQPFTSTEAYLHLKGTDIAAGRLAETSRHNQANEGLSGERNQIAFSRVMNSQAAQQARLDLDATKLDEGTKTAILSEAGRNVAADLTGKKTIETEVAALTKARSGMASPTGQPPAPAQAAAPPARPATVPAGSAWSAQRQMWRDPAGKLYDKTGAASGG